MIKQWFTAREIADFRLPGIPETERGALKKANKENWRSRQRPFGKGLEYHVSSLPAAAQVALIERLVDLKPDTLKIRITDDEQPVIDRAVQRRDARIVILKMLDVFRACTSLGRVNAMRAFETLYAGRKVEGMPPWVYAVFPKVGWQTLHRWSQRKQRADLKGLSGRYGNRLGTGILETALKGQVKTTITALVIKQPHLTAVHIRDMVRAQFGDTIDGQNLPSVRTFRRTIEAWKADNADLRLKMTDPDAYKSRFAVSAGKAGAGIDRLNQVWEIDASPADVLLADGRYSIYALIDVWSRRVRAVVTKTPRAEAALMLIRRAIMEWGVPETIRTDNGKDFTSRRFVTSLATLDIEQDLCPPFTPESKPFIERAIGTMQRDLMPLLPGFIGHSVSDRKAIETRKAFAQRLGEDPEKAFAASMSKDAMQKALDAWCRDRYEHKEHTGLDGMTPFARAASWSQPVKRIENERALDLLLAPLAGGQSTRIVTKKGLRLEKAHFWHNDLVLHMGKTVFVRHDPEDMGCVYAFQDDGITFICKAINPEREGISRAAVASAAKAHQRALMKERTAEIKREMARIDRNPMDAILLMQDRQDRANVTSFPIRAETHTTPALEQAHLATTASPPSELTPEQEDAHRLIKAEMLSIAASPNFLSDEDRWFERYQKLRMKERNGISLSPEETAWLRRAESAPWCKSRLDLIAMRTGETVA